jgi:hypothetical protein
MVSNFASHRSHRYALLAPFDKLFFLGTFLFLTMTPAQYIHDHVERPVIEDWQRKEYR